MKQYSLAIHGGAGAISRKKMTEEKSCAYRAALSDALAEAENILLRGGTALEAVEKAVMNMEDSPLFNAGKGAVYTHEGKHEMDAAIMCGKTLDAGAVSLISTIRNPIVLAKTILERSEHIFLAGEGAMEFAKQENIAFEDAAWFNTEFRFNSLQKAKMKQKIELDHNEREDKYGTVGAVALDQYGNLAAATSTGGMTNKRFGRIGDSPLIGIGTYANNKTCAISCTGKGEDFIRAMVAYDISCLMEYKGFSLEAASRFVVQSKLPVKSGGLIAVDSKGNIVMPFNSEGMYRASVSNSKAKEVFIFQP